ncbi:MAG: hypothetical protein K9K38_06895 [Rhodoferax sp.]|nr:hypothetical protein [Rhodoferax sp.]
MKRQNTITVLAGLLVSLPLLTGCSVVAVADAAVTVVSTGVKAGAKVVGAAVDAVLPDSEDEKK